MFLHYYNLFLMCVVAVPILVGRREQFVKTFGCLSATAALMAIPFALWSPQFVRQLAGWSAPDVHWWKHAVYFPVYVFGGRTFVWKEDGLAMMAAAGILVLVAIGLPVLVALRKSPRMVGVPLAIGIGLPIVAILVSLLNDPMLNCRYLAPVIPCFARRRDDLGRLAMAKADDGFRDRVGCHDDDRRGGATANLCGHAKG